MKKTISQVSLALGLLGGCSSGGPAERTPTTTVSAAEAEADLQRLRALEVFDVGQLLLALPAEATACYNLPCPGWEEQVAAEVARQAPRLERLVRSAEELRREARAEVAPDAAELAADLQKLRDLEIVQVGELVLEAPASNPTCYNLPCAEDIAAAELENRTRAAVVKLLAERAEQLGY